MKRKEFVVFGVGDFGMYVAKTLANSGATVMVVDKDEERFGDQCFDYDAVKRIECAIYHGKGIH